MVMELLLKNFTPDHYDLSLSFAPDKKTAQCTAIITGTAHRPTIKLHAKNLKNLRISQDIPSPTNPTQQKINFTQSADTITLTPIKTGKIRLTITYTLAISTNMTGPYLSTYRHAGKKHSVVATQFESHYARQCFPCIDEPAAKATFALAITTPDPTDTVISNMPIKNVVKNTTFFETTPKMSTYLLAFVIGKFNKLTTTSAHGVKITSYCALNHPASSLKFANEIASKSLDYYDTTFKTPYPLPKLDQVALPDFDSGAMENWGLVTYREQFLIVADHTPLEARRDTASVIAHELSHQWFGNLVTMKWWDDLWLNESFATLIEYFAVDAIRPDFHIWEDFYTHQIVAALRRDALPGVQAVRQTIKDPEEITTLFDGAIVYAKGARLILMLMRLIGKANFIKGLTTYFKNHAYSNTTADDLWAALTPHATFNVKDFMTPWLTQSGYPVLTGSSQHRFLLTGQSSPETYPIPKIKSDLSGHYIINLSDRALSAALTTFTQKSLEQKLRILIDRSLLTKTPLAASATLVDIISPLKNESAQPIWDIISLIISDLKIFITPDTPEETAFKSLIRHLATPQYHRLGLKPKPNEPEPDTILRPLILALIAYSEDPAYIRSALARYTQNLTALDPNTRANILTAKVKHDPSPTLINHLIATYKSTPDPELRTDLALALSATKDPATIDLLLANLKDPSIVRPQDVLHFYIYIVRNPRVRPKAWQWLRENWPWIKTTFGADKNYNDFPRYTATVLRTPKELKEYQTFFAKESQNPLLKRTIAVGTTEIRARIALIKSDAPALHQKLIQAQKVRDTKHNFSSAL
jgi:aminopeptidase N